MENDEDQETLGEKLYDLIYPKYTEMTPKLTGGTVYLFIYLSV